MRNERKPCTIVRGAGVMRMPATAVIGLCLLHVVTTARAADPFRTVPPIALGQTAAQPPASAPAEEPAVTASPVSDKATFLLSKSLFHNDPEILWPGFLKGMRGFEHFYEPVGDPIYFESPFNNTSLRLFYLHHSFPRGSQIGGGNLNIYAAQIRVALTERLGFIAVKDGYSDLNAGILPPEEGWNNLMAGLKYAFIMDRANDFVLTGGLRWEMTNGTTDILQSSTQELSPFVSFAKGWDRLHLLGNISGRLPMDRHRGNYILSWDLHLDYEVLPEQLPGFAPMIEFNGVHYLSDGDHLPLNVGGLDYANLGSNDVAGDGVVSAGIGFRWKLTPNMSMGAVWAFPMQNPDTDIMGNRVTVDFIVNW